MSSSPEIEQFEITDDDFATAFNPERKKFRMSKNQAIYGNTCRMAAPESRIIM